MSSRRLYAAFQEIDLSYFRRKSLSKGRKLLESFHVDNVFEDIDPDGNHQICGRVLRETPGAVSQKNNRNHYAVKLKLSEERVVQEAYCSCQMGFLSCKHGAAVGHYVNFENCCSKTSEPMIWNKPSEKQLQLYKKGCRLDSPELFEQKFQEIDRRISRDVPNLTEFHETLLSPQTEMVLAEKRFLAQRDEIEKQKAEEERNLRGLLDSMYELQLQKSEIYHAYTCEIGENLKLTLKKIECPGEYSAQYDLVRVDRQKWMDICVKSNGQSACATWFQQRYVRITTSSKAHDIKTRQNNFEGLASRFVNDKYRGRATEAMVYGMKMEFTAVTEFQKITGLEVISAGMFVSIPQPFLSTSPDGIVKTPEGTLELLEVKCPYTRKDLEIVDLQGKISYMDYLIFDENGVLELKKSHKYYSQVQVSMYVLNIDLCHFFVYSSKDNVHIKIPRDDNFLIDVIPKLEQFYFEHFIPLLAKKNSTTTSTKHK